MDSFSGVLSFMMIVNAFSFFLFTDHIFYTYSLFFGLTAMQWITVIYKDNTFPRDTVSTYVIVERLIDCEIRNPHGQIH